MANQKMQSGNARGYRGLSPGLPSVSKFRSGYLPAGMNPGRVTDNMSESDTEICSSSEDESYGARYSPEASPKDDKISNGRAKQTDFLNGRTGKFTGHGSYLEREGVNGGVFASMRYGYSNDQSLESVSTSEASSTSERPSEVIPCGRSIKDSLSTRTQENIVDDIPSAPPVVSGSFFQHVRQTSEKAQPSKADSEILSARSRDYATEVESEAFLKNKLGTTELNPTAGTMRAASASWHGLPSRYPTFHASQLGYWYAVLSYDACVRLCLHSWARGCMEAPVFLENECALLRDTFGLKHILLQSEEEVMQKESPEHYSEGASVKTKKAIGKIKVQVRKVKIGLEPPTGCTLASFKSQTSVKMESLQLRMANVMSVVSSERKALKSERVTPVITVKGSLFHRSMAYIVVRTRHFFKEAPELIKVGFNAWQGSSASYEVAAETYSCLLRLKSSPEEDAVKMLPGSGEGHVFLPDGLADDILIEVHDSKRKYCGHAVVQVADIADESGEKLRSYLLYREPYHEQVGRIQLFINYSTTPDENSHKCTPVAETIAYDCVLEAAMKAQNFHQRNLLLHGSWKWLVTEFATYFGVSDAYTKLRYLSYVMDVGTPTSDCLNLVNDLLVPVIIKGKSKHTVSHQEVRMLGEMSDSIDQMLTLVFENYKSLDESSSTGIVDVLVPTTGIAAPAIAPALQLYNLLHDILSPEVQSKLCRYFQNAIKKRSRRHLSETDEFVSNNTENLLMDPVALSAAYRKMKSICLNIRNEISTDIEIHELDVLPSFIDLPNLSSSIYSTELSSRLKAFLVSCPPPGPTPPVVELVIATADFQRELALWNISYFKGGVDAKELFHVYITLWIQEKRLALLELCKVDKAKTASIGTNLSADSFIDKIYGRIRETLIEYDFIISRWPEYGFTLENAIADIEKAVVEGLERQYADVLSPLKENTPMKFGLKYVQKFTMGTSCIYSVSAKLGFLLNSMKRMLDTLRPQIETQLKLWGSCMPETRNMVPGECLSEVTVMIRSKFRAYVQAVVEKLVENTKLRNNTKLKRIIQESKENVIESDIRRRIQPLRDAISSTIDQLHAVLDTQVFVIVCRSFWDRMGQDVLKFLEDRKENRSWYKATRVAVTVVDDTFASQMQKLLGNALQEKDLELPRSVIEVRSMLIAG